MRDQYQLDRRDVQFVYNSSGTFFLNTFSGRLFGAGIKHLRVANLDLDYEDDNESNQSVAYPEAVKLDYLKEYSGIKSSVIGASSVGRFYWARVR